MVTENSMADELRRREGHLIVLFKEKGEVDRLISIAKEELKLFYMKYLEFERGG